MQIYEYVLRVVIHWPQTRMEALLREMFSVLLFFEHSHSKVHWVVLVILKPKIVL